MAYTPSPPAVVAEAGVEGDRKSAAVFRSQRQLHPTNLIRPPAGESLLLSRGEPEAVDNSS